MHQTVRVFQTLLPSYSVSISRYLPLQSLGSLGSVGALQEAAAVKLDFQTKCSIDLMYRACDRLRLIAETMQ